MSAGLAAADEDSAAAASFVAERVTLEDMRNWVCSAMKGCSSPCKRGKTV